MTTKVSTTIRLSDTVDQWSRRVHVNVRNKKVTTVYRWKSKDGRDHTQRITLNDDQTSRLLAALVNAQDKVMAGDESRKRRSARNSLSPFCDKLKVITICSGLYDYHTQHIERTLPCVNLKKSVQTSRS